MPTCETIVMIIIKIIHSKCIPTVFIYNSIFKIYGIATKQVPILFNF